MNWRDRISNIVFEITTGDGKTYRPILGTNSQRIVFNANISEYYGIKGSYVKKGKEQGHKFPFEFYFTDDEHIDRKADFVKSASDSRPWKVKTPYFDELTVQALDISVNPWFGSTQITCELAVTIDINNLQQEDDSTSKLNETINKNSDYVSDNIISKSPAQARNFTTIFDKNYNLLPNTNEQAVKLKNIVRDCTRKSTSILDAPVDFNESLRALINFPNEIGQDLKSSFQSMLLAFDEMAELIGIDANLFELGSQILFGSMAKNSIDTDYRTQRDIVERQNRLAHLYEQYITLLEQNDYEPNSEATFNLQLLINRTIGNLFEISKNTKRLLIVTAEKEKHSLIYSHQYYGTSDEKYKQFIQDNELTFDEILLIPRGKQLYFYL